MDKFLPPIPVDPQPTALRIVARQLNFAARNGNETNSQTWGFSQKQNFDLCFEESFGINERVLYEESDGYFDYEAETLIRSNQLITSTSKVDYDSSVEILLENGFEIQQGAEFEAFIDGCNIGAEGIHE